MSPDDDSDDDDGGLTTLIEDDGPATGDGVGGTIVGVAGCVLDLGGGRGE